MAKLTDITPKRWRCANASSMCPAVFTLADITPKQHRCDVTVSCPAVFIAPNDKLVIIGKRCENNAIAHRVGPDEVAIEVDADMIKQALKEVSDDTERQ